MQDSSGRKSADGGSVDRVVSKDLSRSFVIERDARSLSFRCDKCDGGSMRHGWLFRYSNDDNDR